MRPLALSGLSNTKGEKQRAGPRRRFVAGPHKLRLVLMRRIYVTHCSAKKNETIRTHRLKVTPDKLYTARLLQKFVSRCLAVNADLAIFSDLYGIWFPTVERGWYEKSPDSVTEEEFAALLDDFDQSLGEYDQVWFYHNPGRFHRLYRRLVESSTLRHKIHMFSHIREIA